MKSGIYAIYNSKSGKAYIGQSKDVERRKRDHFRELRKGTHHNQYLQRSYDLDGEDNFHFIIMELCPVDKLDEVERQYIRRMQLTDSFLGYNLEDGGNVGKEVSEKVREAKRGDKNPMYGKRISPEHIEALKIKNRGHGSSLSAAQVSEIKEALYKKTLSSNDLAKKYGVSRDVICKIKTGQNWRWVREELNEKITESYHKGKRDKKIKEFEKLGYSRTQIKKELNISDGTVERVLKKKSSYFKDSPEKKEKIDAVVKDFKRGLSKEEIMKKHEISSSVYVSWTHEALIEKENAIKEKAIEMRKTGMMVKDIAAELGYARTTISRWTKCVK